MQPLNAPRRADPSPSRWSYRLQRWMLTPGFRLALRAGIPFAAVFLATSAYLNDPERRDALLTKVSEVRRSVQERPEFMVGVMAIDGAGRSVSEDIREVVSIDFPVSSFDLDIEGIRETIEELDPVADASVRIRPGGVLQVDVIERRPALVWRTRDGLQLIDATGAYIDHIATRGAYPDLPLVAGTGADARVAQALRLFAAARPLGARLRGLVRVGERRWDVVLDRGQRILLPETGPVQALERVIALGAADDMLDRDVTVIDMRISARPTLRMSEAALSQWWTIRKMNQGGQY
ncbi:MAG: cell division protein FtsQ/DivIB [Rhodobacteraceae bacterium]|nr:cell division protein FtsQ/DivIB [Paracoccaceae bacterium]